MRNILLLVFLAFLFSGCGQTLKGKSGQLVHPQPMRPKAEASFHYLRYQDALRNNKPDDAIESLEKAVNIEPTPDLFFELASLYWNTGKHDKAKIVLKQGIDRYPDNKLLYRSLASSYLSEERYEAAAITIKTFLNSHPDDWEAKRDLASVYLEQKNFSKAMEILKEIPEKEQDAEYYFLKGRVHVGLKEYSKAVASLKKTTSLEPGHREAWLELGYVYELQKDYASAEATYNHLLQIGETSPQVWLRLITLNLKLNNPDRALNLTIKAPLTEAFILEAGRLFLQEKFYSQAQKIFEIIENKKDVDPKLYFLLAILAYDGEKDAQEAASYLQKIPAKDPLHKQALSFLGQIYIQEEQYEKAIEAAEKGKKLYPKESAFWIIQIARHEQQKDYTTALKVTKNALNSLPDDTSLLYRKGVIYEHLDKRDQAMEVMEKIITLDPGHADALNFVGYTLAEEKKDLERALILVKNALKQDPDNGYFLDSLAWVYFMDNNLEKAWNTIQRAVEQVDSDPIIWEHYGDIARARGNKKEARAGYKKSLANDPKDPDFIQEKLNNL